jgi:hypothetical protein
VPLSEHEQRVLEQIERSLYADDPKFAATVRGIDPRARQRRRYARSVIGAVIGLIAVAAGIAVAHSEITVAGGVIAVLALSYGMLAWHRGVEHPDAHVAAPTHPSLRGRLHAGSHQPRVAHGPKRPMMQRFEDRWNRRRGE